MVGSVRGEGRGPRLRWVGILALVLAVTTGLGVVLDRTVLATPSPSAPPATSVSPETGPSPLPSAPTGPALEAVRRLTVTGRAPLTGYDRDAFGQAWLDTDRNGCDTRNDVLRRDLTATMVRPGTHGCVVLSGTLADPYTGRTVAFVRGQQTSRAVQVDHVVALADAWQKGARQWSAPTARGLRQRPSRAARRRRTDQPGQGRR